MKRRRLFLFLLMLSALHAQAQDETSVSAGMTDFPEQHPTRVFGDKVNVRAKAAVDAAVVAQLKAGAEVTVVHREENELTLNGWTAPWYRVAFRHEGRPTEGYIWGGLLSPTVQQAGDVSFVYGVVKAKAPTPDEAEFLENEVEFRAVRNGEVISAVRAKMSFPAFYATHTSQQSGLGLKNIRKIFQVDFSGEACGYPYYSTFCLWDGQRLTLLPVLESVADGGVFFESEDYIFPEQEGGLPERLLYVHEAGSMDEEAGSSDLTRRVRPMVWNGKAYVKPALNKN